MIKIALPAGDIRSAVADFLDSRGLPVEGYGQGSRSYRLAAQDASTTVRVFREKDIPIQVALGNYDLGICDIAWVKEMQVRFPSQPVIPLSDLGFGGGMLLAAAAAFCGGLPMIASLPVVRIASEFPNIAEAFVMATRFTAYRVQSVWGSAEVYPPEDADLVVLLAGSEEAVSESGLAPLTPLLATSAWLIGNEESLRKKELAPVLGLLGSGGASIAANGLHFPPPVVAAEKPLVKRRDERKMIRLAVPDGHQQQHVVEALDAAGLKLDGYDKANCVRRPVSPLPRLEVKVVRPHDMPQLVALGQFDLGVTGRDCLLEHLHRFPSSPVQELCDLGRGAYNLSAVVSEDLPADDIETALEHWRAEGKRAIRIASEFMGTADYYARSRHFWRYQVIPIAGASEGFVPEDAELLIEGTETGKTLRENRLKPIDLLYRSTTCVIGHRQPALEGARRHVFDDVLGRLRTGAAG
ncbi:MAG: ATP phosphoribosyltransferase [Chloroflexi bacterium]|nr:MAG: ATP phosphoribosyltransferase [Chloroflexota bacterium]